ncbi:FecCD family ABC transporter permease [Pseudidiomarina terrestris]|uniref:Iron ABC transporter permease n=1 Tax=Pseudidiomarina terrestris TaxID=2820060 RepID=A0ABT8ML30_9GAMM|nr:MULTISPECIES: iron ABC transporter permease [unclassified Pseudidiomarina]MDN7128138.1 iron ABC transporter permease [Pseudidiomarina sp. 1APR75-33.1]MDN7130664.1 iron ABC transporter permease [Pseudidiomarina sp. 1APR75-15]MDN7136579.1 iron ABC transporter permease [Pseudidiomarina sp. 1ASP75-5]MEA3589136.1 iron ABC transporter permease [Pseudidiomarina sp. 1APP75-27a]
MLRVSLLLAMVCVALLGLHMMMGSSGWGYDYLGAAASTILFDIRLPRALLALLNGIALGTAGAVLQVMFRNPLAEPGITGIAGGSALAIVVVLYSGLTLPLSGLLPVVGMLGGLLSLIALWLIAGGHTSGLRLILAGVAVASFCGALLALVLNLAPNPFAYLEWSLWLLGSVANRGWEQIYLLVPSMVLAFGLLYWQRNFINAHIFDQQTLASLGFRQNWSAWWVLASVTLLISASVVTAGVISFVGLLAPHLARLLGENRPPQLMVLSGLGGGALLLLIDAVVKLVPTTVELQLGVVAAFIGAPWLVYLLMRQARA